MRFVIYGRPGCHLCEVMHEDLRPLATELGFDIASIDVDSDPQARERYGMRIPVLVDDEGGEICSTRLEHDAVRRRLAVK